MLSLALTNCWCLRQNKKIQTETITEEHEQRKRPSLTAEIMLKLYYNY